MFQFVYWLKAFAAILITNSHYADIWPVSRLAMGGHLGNCLYFFVSGFCLYSIRNSFPGWYAKRIVRIYPALWIVAAINLLVGFWRADGPMAYIHCLIYPTWYHFIASILVLYIVYYILRRVQMRLNIQTIWLLLLTLAVYLTAYLLWCDKSYYHIDDVEEKWCRFQFMASMLVGALCRENYEKIRERISAMEIIELAGTFAAYFAVKLLISRNAVSSYFQFLLPVIQVLLIYFIGVLAVKLEKRGAFSRAPAAMQKAAAALAGISLEVYLTQNYIISRLGHLAFPINFLVVTGVILLCSYAVHKAAECIQRGCRKLLHPKTSPKEV